MSQPPSPHGGQPGPPGPAPYGGPPGPYPPPLPGKPSGMSNKAKFWIGVALTLPVLVVAGVISGVASAVVDGISGSTSAASAVAFVVGLGQLAVVVAAVVYARTRWFAIGVIAGVAVLFVLAAGACVVLIIGLTSSYN